MLGEVQKKNRKKEILLIHCKKHYAQNGLYLYHKCHDSLYPILISNVLTSYNIQFDTVSGHDLWSKGELHRQMWPSFHGPFGKDHLAQCTYCFSIISVSLEQSHASHVYEVGSGDTTHPTPHGQNVLFSMAKFMPCLFATLGKCLRKHLLTSLCYEIPQT